MKGWKKQYIDLLKEYQILGHMPVVNEKEED